MKVALTDLNGCNSHLLVNIVARSYCNQHMDLVSVSNLITFCIVRGSDKSAIQLKWFFHCEVLFCMQDRFHQKCKSWAG